MQSPSFVVAMAPAMADSPLLGENDWHFGGGAPASGVTP